MKIVVTMLLMMAPVAATGAEIVREVPPEFRGRWQSDIPSCSGAEDAGTIIIREDSYEEWEAGGRILAVVTGYDDDIIIVGEFTDYTDSAEGDKWIWSKHYALNESKDTLVIEGMSDSALRRCPQPARTP